MTLLPTPVLLKNGDSGVVHILGTYAPGNYTVQIQPNGNSLLSSLLVTSVSGGASVQLNYWQTTSADEFGERTNLSGHSPISTASTSADQVLVTRIHNKVFAELVVTGGSVVCGVYVTVVSMFASDLEAALKKNLDPLDPTDRGLPAMALDEFNRFTFIPLVNGKVPVEATLNLTPGTPLSFRGEALSVPTSVTTQILEYTVPTGKRLTLHRVDFGGNNIAEYSVTVSGSLSDRAWTWFSGNLNGAFDYGPSGNRVAAGAKVLLEVIHSRTMLGDFSGRISGVIESI